MNGSTKPPKVTQQAVAETSTISAARPAKEKDKSKIVAKKLATAARYRNKKENAKRSKEDEELKKWVEADFIDRACALSLMEREHAELKRHSSVALDNGQVSDDTLSDLPDLVERPVAGGESKIIPDTPPEVLFTFKSSPGKGIGAFANQDIKKGTEVLVEEAIIRGQGPKIFHEAIFNVLSKHKQDRILYLYNRCTCGSIPSLETPLMRIWATNAFGNPNKPGLYELASRFNHSCVPNLARGFSKEDYIIFQATRDIKQGEELTVNYVPIPGSNEQKRVFLEQFGFICECECCQGRKAYRDSVINDASLPNGVETKSPALWMYTDEEVEKYAEVFAWHKEIQAMLSTIQATLTAHLRSYAAVGQVRVADRKRPTLVDDYLDAVDRYLKQNNKFGLCDAFFDAYRASTKPEMLEQTEENFILILSDPGSL